MLFQSHPGGTTLTFVPGIGRCPAVEILVIACCPKALEIMNKKKITNECGKTMVIDLMVRVNDVLIIQLLRSCANIPIFFWPVMARSCTQRQL